MSMFIGITWNNLYVRQLMQYITESYKVFFAFYVQFKAYYWATWKRNILT